jgi:hypothetical protein
MAPKTSAAQPHRDEQDRLGLSARQKIDNPDIDLEHQDQPRHEPHLHCGRRTFKAVV